MLVRIIYIYFLSLMAASCKKFVTVEHVEGRYLVPEAFSSDSVANAAVAGIYQEWKSYYNNVSSPTVLLGLSADELKVEPASNEYTEYYRNDIGSNNSMLPWAKLYNIIYQTNLCIESLNQSDGLSQLRRNYYLGEAQFIRANCYFNLINIFGDIPLLLSSNLDSNSIAPRTSAFEVYDQIILDLTSSEILMQDEIFSAGQQGRLNPDVVRAFLARIHLYLQHWQEAKTLSTSVIESGKYSLETELDQVFTRSSKESIFQFLNNSKDGLFDAFALSPIFSNISLNNSLVKSREENDQRYEKWMSSPGNENTYAHKYKSFESGNQLYTLFRLAEQLLIRAEASARSGSTEAAVGDINMIRVRAGLSPLTSDITPDSCLKIIFKERRVELFAETGHRWFDLKRAKNIHEILSVEKGDLWMDSDSLYPIPKVDIQRNPNLRQNPNYE